MTKRAIARRGDRTTHGGMVLAGDPTFIVLGKEVARVGDPVSCPRCKCVTQIVTGSPTAFDGTMVARHDDLTACGAKLIASQFTDVVDDGTEPETGAVSQDLLSESAGTSNSLAEAASSEQEEASQSNESFPRRIRFQAIDPISGQPMPKRPYVLTRENGVQHGGLTDSGGYTEPIDTDEPERIAVHFMFANPDGRTIDKEELLP
jgi:uncharacterized Zn-binding protein involved in type VI secretion